MKSYYYLCCIVLFLFSCKKNENTQPPPVTPPVTFAAIAASVNGNIQQPFKLASLLPALNKVNFQFEDITDKAGVASISDWCTGVTMADVNSHFKDVFKKSNIFQTDQFDDEPIDEMPDGSSHPFLFRNNILPAHMGEVRDIKSIDGKNIMFITRNNRPLIFLKQIDN